MTNYYSTQEYIFRWIDKNEYEADLYEPGGFPSDNDNLCEIRIMIGCDENGKIYFPFILYLKTKQNLKYMFINGALMLEYISDDGKVMIEEAGGMGNDYISKDYGDIYIKYETLEDIYKFIQTLVIEFPKNTFTIDSVFKMGSSNDLRVKTQFIDKLIYWHTHFTIKEFTLKYFIDKLDYIMHTDKYIHLLPSDYFIKKLDINSGMSGCLNIETKPIHALMLPYQNNDKLKNDYPILDKWL